MKIIKFADYPEFRPNLSPAEIFQLGAFGGTYWRPIHSTITGKDYHDQHLEFPKSWWKNANEKAKSLNYLTSEICQPKVNFYKKVSGTSLEYWEKKGWIVPQDPYGWVQWYCRFYQGRRTPDDQRQIKRWQGIAGKNGRFRKRLINLCREKKKKYDDPTVSPTIRQLLLQWGYQLNKADFDEPN